MTTTDAIPARGYGRTLIACIAMFLLWAIFLRHAFSYARSFGIYQDNEYFIGTVLSYMAHSFGNGEWPLRMDTLLGGLPLYDFSQLSPFYLLYGSFLSIFNGPVDAARSLHIITLLHLFIFEINVYVLLRTIGISRISSVAGAVLIAFGANSFNYATWINITAPYAWLPLYCAGLVGMLDKPRAMIYPIIAIIGAVLLCLASPAQPLIHMVFISVFLCGVWMVSKTLAGRSVETFRPLCTLFGVGVVAALITAPVILPAVMDFPKMIRWIGPFPAVVGNGAIPFEAFQIGQLSVRDLAGVLFKTSSLAVGSQYVGVLAVALACVAIVSRPRYWLVISLALIALYSLISATGVNLGLAYLNYHIPLINKIREPSRFLYLFQLSVGILAAVGLDEISRIVNERGQENRHKKFLVLIAVTLVACIVGFCFRDQLSGSHRPYLPIVLLIILTGMTWVLSIRPIQFTQTFMSITWGVALLAVLNMHVPWNPPHVAGSDYALANGLSLDLVLDKVAALDPEHEYRVVFEGNIDKQRAAMLASYKGIRSFNSYFNPAPNQQFNELYYHAARKDNYFQVLGAKYIVCDVCSYEVVRQYHRVTAVAGYQIYETERVLPHSFISLKADGVYENLGDFTEKAAGSTLLKPVLFVLPGAALTQPDEHVATETCLKKDRVRSAVHYGYLIECGAAGVMVLNEYHDLAWKVFVDGDIQPLLKVNGNQMGVMFSKGSHTIDFRYLPGTFFRSLLLGVFGVFFAAGGLVYLYVTRKNRGQ